MTAIEDRLRQVASAPVETPEFDAIVALSRRLDRRRRAGYAVVGLMSAALVAGIGFGWTALRDDAAEVITDPKDTTPVEEAPSLETDGDDTTDTTILPMAPGRLTPMPGPAEVVEGHEPFGEVSITHVAGESTVVPVGSAFQVWGDWGPGPGGIVETPTGYASLSSNESGWTIAVSSDGHAWREVDGGLTVGPARLFEAGGWYWVESFTDNSLFRSTDLESWDEVDLGEESPGPQGVPLTDRRWTVYGDHLVAFSWPTGLLSVDIESGRARTHEVPWVPPDGIWWWLAVGDGELSAYISSIPDSPATESDPTIELYVTDDLDSWSGPMTPRVVTDETRGLHVHGAENSGLIAASALIPTPANANYDLAITGLYFSADGEDWQTFDVPGGLATEDWWFPALVPIRVGDRQGLVRWASSGRQFYLSDDGVRWQSIRLERPTGPDGTAEWRQDTKSLTVADGKLFFYEQTGAWANSWVISLADAGEIGS